jgi:outer membrane protein assembly factor BamB
MLVAPSSIAVSAASGGSAPTAAINLQVTNLSPGDSAYWSVKYSTVGIASLADTPTQVEQQATIYFKPPEALGVGVYHDTITVSACYGQSCTQQFQGSPQTVSVQYTVTAAPLTLSSTYPGSVTVGGPAFTLEVLGNGFSKSTTVLWNGSARPTTFVSGTELLAQIGAADIAATGAAEVEVQDPEAPNGSAGPQAVTIGPASIDATAYQINPAHSGTVSFSSVSFPAGPAWSVDVGGVPSYALIANGEIFVTVNLSSGGSQLVALSQSTGATVWGPIALPGPGPSNAAYDDGYVFVASAAGLDSHLQAFDAQSGQQKWSENASYYGLTEQFGVPTASHGLVFAAADAPQSSIGLIAADETTGAGEWEEPISSDDFRGPAVGVDGVYLTYPCGTGDFRPATGESVWSAGAASSSSCLWSGAPPVVANQLVYSPPGDTNDPGGFIFDAESGTNTGAYAYNSGWPPAIASTTTYYLSGGTLSAVSASDDTVLWTFTGDGSLAGAPIVVNQYVIVASSSGSLYALDGASGAQIWVQSLPSGFVPESNGSVISGLAPGDGLLVVPSGNEVVAYVLSTSP